MAIKFSMVTAVLNRRKELDKMMSSVAAQTFSNFELILVDNGSTDGTWEYCQQLNDKRIVVLQCKRRGISFARNKGICASSGEWILILDSDNVFSSDDVLEKLASYIDSFPKAICILTRNCDRYGRLLSFCKKLDQYLSFGEYVVTSGEFSPVVQTDWYKRNLHPTIDGVRHEFAYCVYAKAAIEEKLVISSLVAQIYGMDADDRICSTELPPQRAWELHHYYRMLISDFSHHLIRQAPVTWFVWSFKYLVYGRIARTISVGEYLKSSAFVGWLIFWCLPSKWLRHLVLLAKGHLNPGSPSVPL